MKMYLVRHGQTNVNSKRLIQGRADIPLNNVGKKQAKDAGQLLKSLKVDFKKIVSSPLSRALETGYLIGKKNNYKDFILINPKLIERDFGKYEMSSIAENFPVVMAPGFSDPTFEANDVIESRVFEAIKELYLEFSNDNIILTVHAHVIRALYILFDNTKYTYTNFFLGNGSIHVFDFDGVNLELLETYLNEEQ